MVLNKGLRPTFFSDDLFHDLVKLTWKIITKQNIRKCRSRKVG